MKPWGMTLGVCGLAAWLAAASVAACTVTPAEPGSGDPGAAEPEQVGEAEQAVGLGGLCSSSSQCYPGLDCCWTQTPIPHGNCRYLREDVNNCGSCGRQCNLNYCYAGDCVVCLPDVAPCDHDSDCCSGYCHSDGLCGVAAGG